MLTMALNTLNPHIVPVLSYPCLRWSQKRNAKKAVTQRELNHVFEGETFTLAERYTNRQINLSF